MMYGNVIGRILNKADDGWSIRKIKIELMVDWLLINEVFDEPGHHITTREFYKTIRHYIPAAYADLIKAATIKANKDTYYEGKIFANGMVLVNYYAPPFYLYRTQLDLSDMPSDFTRDYNKFCGTVETIKDTYESL